MEFDGACSLIHPSRSVSPFSFSLRTIQGTLTNMEMTFSLWDVKIEVLQIWVAEKIETFELLWECEILGLEFWGWSSEFMRVGFYKGRNGKL